MARGAWFVSDVTYTLSYKIILFKNIEAEISISLKNKPAEAGVLKIISFCMSKSCKYNTIIRFN